VNGKRSEAEQQRGGTVPTTSLLLPVPQPFLPRQAPARPPFPSSAPAGGGSGPIPGAYSRDPLSDEVVLCSKLC